MNIDKDVINPVYDRQSLTTVILPGRLEVVSLLGLIAYYLLADEIYGNNNYETPNIVGPIWFSSILLISAARLAYSHECGIWMPLFWLRLATATYYGIGAVVPYFVNDLTRLVINSFYLVPPDQALKVNIITTVGLVTVLFSAAFLAVVRPCYAYGSNIKTKAETLLTWGLIYGCVGLIAKYVFVIPYLFGVTQQVLPGAISNLAVMTSVGIYMLSTFAFSASRGMILPITIIAMVDITVGLLTFSKSDVIFPLLMYCLGFLHSRTSRIRLALTLGGISLCFFYIAPIVDYGRISLIEKYGDGIAAGFSARIEVLEEYFLGVTAFGTDPFRGEFQGAAARLSYMNQSAFAVDLYDRGERGDTLSAIIIVAIPRFLWPEKVNLNYLGQSFNVRATNNAKSLSWPGQFVEAYWNLGWWGIPLLMIPLGVFYYVLSSYSFRILVSGNWVYFPTVLFGVRYGLDIGSPFALAAVGGLAYVGAVHLGCMLLDLCVKRVMKK